MKIDKEKLAALAALPDDALWKEIRKIAGENKISLPEATPKKEEMAKIRSLLLNSDKINMFSAMKFINELKRGGK